MVDFRNLVDKPVYFLWIACGQAKGQSQSNQETVDKPVNFLWISCGYTVDNSQKQ